MTTTSTPTPSSNTASPRWQLSLLEAVIAQGKEVGIEIPAEDLTFLADSASAAQASYWQDMQLEVTAAMPDWDKVSLPAIAVFNEGSETASSSASNATPFYAVVLSVDRQTKGVQVLTKETTPLLLSLTEFAPQRLLALRKSLDKIYVEQAIPSETGHWFWKVFRQEMPVFNKVLIAAFFANLLAAVASFFSLQVYDRVIPTKSEETLWALLIGVLIAFGLEAALRIARSNLLDFSGKKIDIQSSAFLLRRLMGLRLKADSPSPNHLSQMMREFNSVREFFTEAAVGSLIDIPFALLFLFIIYLIGGQVVWVAIIAMVLMVVPPLLFRGRMMKIIASTLGARGAANRLYQESSYQLETLKMTQAERFFEKQWDDVSQVLCDVSMRQRHLVSLLTQWATSMQQIAYVMTVTVAVYAAFEGKLTMGAIIALNILVSRALAPITRLSSLLIRWSQVKSSLNELDMIAKGEQDDPLTQRKLRRPSLQGALALQQVQYAYDKDSRAALNIGQLVIRPNEKVAILGPNGSGKSTLLKLLSGIQFAQQGEIKCDGVDIRQIASRDLRRQMTYITQESQLFSGTLRQNLTLGNEQLSDEQLIEALQRTGLGGFLASHPYGLDLRIRDGGTGLSVGQKQSLQLARMLLREESRILLLDEPTASLDPTVEGQLIHTLAQFARHRTLVVVTHRTPILALVDRIIVLAEGQVIADGPREVILNRIQQAQQPPAQPKPQAPQAQPKPQTQQTQQAQPKPQQPKPDTQEAQA